MLLELLGHQVRVASDGFVALDILAENTFDVILVDIGLPGMDGYTLASHIRALPTAQGMRLVALTGYGQDEDRRRALAAGLRSSPGKAGRYRSPAGAHRGVRASSTD